MKVVFHLTLALFYWASSMGTQVRLHWCGGEFENISLFAESNEDCCEKTTEKSCCVKKQNQKPCCQDGIIKAEIKDEHRASQAKIHFSPFLIEKIFTLNIPRPEQIEWKPVFYTSVVFANGPPLYLKFKQLRIGNTELA